jgi:hypothetical protein
MLRKPVLCSTLIGFNLINDRLPLNKCLVRVPSLHSTVRAGASRGQKVLSSGNGVEARQWALVPSMLRFAGIALLVPLTDPLLSLIDTICIGRVSVSHITRLSLSVVKQSISADFDSAGDRDATLQASACTSLDLISIATTCSH